MSNARALKVLRIPTESNHYQDLSVKALRGHDIDTTRVDYLDLSIAAGFVTHDIIHVDWLDGFVRSTKTFRERLRAQTLLTVALVGCIIARRPVFWTLHNSQPHTGAGAAWRVWKFILARLATDVVTLSPAAARHAQTLHIKGTLSELTFGRFLEVFPPVERDLARMEWLSSEASILLVHFGQIREQKGIDALLASIARLADSDVEWIVAGTVPNPRTKQMLLTAAAGDERIKVVPRYLDDGELASLLSAADIIVMPFEHSLTSSSAQVAAEYGIAMVAPDSDLFRSYGSYYLYDSDQGLDGLVGALRNAIDDCRVGCLQTCRLTAPSWQNAVEPLARQYRRAVDRGVFRRFERAGFADRRGLEDG